jgi:hypothetical protein
MPADDVIRIRDRYAESIEASLAEGRSRRDMFRQARMVIADESFSTIKGESSPWTTKCANDTRDVTTLVYLIQAACFVVLTYTVGCRVSEIRRACPGCVCVREHPNGERHYYYSVPRSKMRTRIEGERWHARPWILSPGALRALEVLDKLSARLRDKSGIQNYWVKGNGTGLWPAASKTFHVYNSQTINVRLRDLAKFVDLKGKTGWEGRLHTHQGRKCLARFVAKRDRGALEDLAIQFAHVSARSLDLSYARPDSEYGRILREEMAGEFVAAANQLLSTDPSAIFHNDSDEALSKSLVANAKFLGQLRTRREMSTLYTNGAPILPAIYGACSYRVSSSACHGNEGGPNPLLRSSHVCAGCVNFRATPLHEAWWRASLDDDQRVLRSRGIGAQAKEVLRARIARALGVLAVIGKAA